MTASSGPDQVTHPTIQTFSGAMFNIFAPDPADIIVGDIGHALGNICRYGGHCQTFYSVASHSTIMAEYFEDKNLLELARVALLHDATEAYLGDMVRPLKQHMPAYQTTEWNLQQVIFQKFGLDPVIPDIIKDADLRICNDERKQLMIKKPWTIDAIPPLGVWIIAEPPIQSRNRWLAAFKRLF